MFWSIKQEKTEPVDVYLTQTKLKLDMCEYAGAVKQEMTRDKFAIGLCDDCIKERLLREEKLDLTMAVGIAQGAESFKQQTRDTSAHSEINAMQCSPIKPLTVETVEAKPRQCLAYSQECGVCHKPNHFARLCHKKPIYLST